MKKFNLNPFSSFNKINFPIFFHFILLIFFIFFLCLGISFITMTTSFACQLETKDGTIQPVPVPNGMAIFMPGPEKPTLFSCGLPMNPFGPAFNIVKINPGQCFTAVIENQRILYQCTKDPLPGPEKCRIDYGAQKIYPQILTSGKGRLISTPLGEILVNCGTKITVLNKNIRTLDLKADKCGTIVFGPNIELLQCDPQK